VGREHFAFTLEGKKKVKLSRFDPGDTAGLEKEEGLARLQKLGEEFAELGNLLTFAGQDALLVVLQGRDASGKDGTIRKILDFSNMQTAHVQGFKVPNEEERAHDFLWRVHKVVPARGHITLFNRSHYEDVLAARVHKVVPEEVWEARYQQINGFERILADNRTIVLKFYLHISKEEQYERLVEREKEPLSAWKLNPNDWRDLTLWGELTEAYEDALEQPGGDGADRAGPAPTPQALAEGAGRDAQAGLAPGARAARGGREAGAGNAEAPARLTGRP
jgi:PPK2 family polyphosphate:nucleotide phosphotransferase